MNRSGATTQVAKSAMPSLTSHGRWESSRNRAALRLGVLGSDIDNKGVSVSAVASPRIDRPNRHILEGGASGGANRVAGPANRGTVRRDGRAVMQRIANPYTR